MSPVISCVLPCNYEHLILAMITFGCLLYFVESGEKHTVLSIQDSGSEVFYSITAHEFGIFVVDNLIVRRKGTRK